MATASNNFEGGSNGAVVSTANAGGSGNTLFDAVSAAGSATFDSSTSAHGTLSAKFATTAGSTSNASYTTSIGSQTTLYGRINVYLTAYPSTNMRFFQVVSSSSVTWTLGITATGNVRSATGSGTNMSLSTATVPLNQWFRIEFKIILSASVAQSVVKYYTQVDGAVTDETNTSTATFTTAANGDTYQFGMMSSTNITYSVNLDDVALSTVGFLGAVNPVLPAFIGWGTPLAVGVSSGRVDPFPATGALWGIYISGNDLPTFETMESEAGRVFGVSKIYYDMASGNVPTPLHLAEANTDHTMIHVSIALSTNTGATPNSRLPAPGAAVAAKNLWTYLQVTSGSMDTYFIWLATQLKNVNRCFTIDINHEPENQSNGVGRNETFSDPTWYSNRANTTESYRQGILKEYADAVRHIRAVFDGQNVTNAVWTNTFATIGSNGASYNSWVYPALWPGDDVIDVCAWDPYDTGGNKTVVNTLAQGYNLIMGGMLDSAPFYAGINAKTKPFVLCETGTLTADATYAANWIASYPAALQQFPNIKAITYWSSAAYALHTVPAARTAFETTSLDAYVAVMPLS